MTRPTRVDRAPDLGSRSERSPTNRERHYPESRFGGFSDIDGTIAFFNRVNALLQPSFTVLDVGCGRGAYGEDPVAFRRNLRILRGKVQKVVGIDVDHAAESNPYIDEFRFMTGSSWPTSDDSIDLIVCDTVLEHVEDIDGFFSEAHRTLRDGGCLCLRTTNRWHYVALAARMVPNRYHARVTSIVQEGRKEQDVFPTLYRCNSLRALRRMFKEYHFDATVYAHESEPSYLGFSRVTYSLGVWYQRLAPSACRVALFGFGKVQKVSVGTDGRSAGR